MTFKVTNELFQTKYPLQYLRRVQGIIALSKKYSNKELEDACEKALAFEKFYVPFIEGLIKNAPTMIKQNKIQRLPNPLLRGDELYQ